MKCKVHQPFIINNDHQNATVEKCTQCSEILEKKTAAATTTKFSLILKTESMPTNAIERKKN